MLLPRHCVAATRYLRWPAFTSGSTGTRVSTASRGRPRFQTCYASSASAATAIDQNALYAQPIPDKLTFHSGLTLTQIPGKGRGVISTQDLEVGQLLAVLPATSILHGPVDDRPTPSELLAHLTSQHASGALTPAQQAALAALYDGTPASLGTVPDMSTLLPSSAGSSSTSTSSTTTTLEPARLEQLVNLNAFGDQYEDLAAATIKDADPSSQIGLWPLFAMFNHSCAPNTVHYVVGSHMVIRAVQQVAAGDELTVSYLGRQEFAPAAVRGQHLLDSHGFTCGCTRCASEQRYSPALTSAIQQIYDQVAQEIKPAYEAIKAEEEAEAEAAESGLAPADPAAQQQRQQQKEALKEKVTACIIALHDALKKEEFTGNPFGMAYAQAALLDLLELQAGNQPAGSTAALAAATTCISALDAVCRGAELHCMLSAKLLQDVMGGQGPEAPAAEAAAQLCQIAHVARYGEVREEVMSELVQMHIYMAEEYVS